MLCALLSSSCGGLEALWAPWSGAFGHILWCLNIFYFEGHLIISFHNSLNGLLLHPHPHHPPLFGQKSCFVVFNMGPLDPSPIQPNPPHPHPHPHSTLPHTILPHPNPLHPMGITFYQFGCVTIDLINLRSFYSPLDALQPNKFMNNVLPYIFQMVISQPPVELQIYFFLESWFQILPPKSLKNFNLNCWIF